MKKPLLAGLLITTLILAMPADAEIYKYIDENGQKRWTDDLGQVPKDQRSGVEHFESAKETPATSSTGDTNVNKQEQHPKQTASDESTTPDRAVLEREKADLDAQFKALMQERAEIEATQSQDISREDREALKSRISAYNQKTEQYEIRLGRFNSQVEKYNQQINAAKAEKKEKE